MTALGVDMSDREPICGWEALTRFNANHSTATTVQPKKSGLKETTQELLNLVWKKQLEVATEIEVCEDDKERALLIGESNAFVTIAQSLQYQLLNMMTPEEIYLEVEQRR